jgi:hypothetical protein
MMYNVVHHVWEIKGSIPSRKRGGAAVSSANGFQIGVTANLAHLGSSRRDHRFRRTEGPASSSLPTTNIPERIGLSDSIYRDGLA